MFGYNNTLYDPCQHKLLYKESTMPLSYMLSEAPVIHKSSKYGKTKQQLVDLESDLRNLTRQLSSCNDKQYNLPKKPITAKIPPGYYVGMYRQPMYTINGTYLKNI